MNARKQFKLNQTIRKMLVPDSCSKCELFVGGLKHCPFAIGGTGCLITIDIKLGGRK